MPSFSLVGEHKLVCASATLSPAADVLAVLHKGCTLGVQRWMAWESALARPLQLPLSPGQAYTLAWSHDGKAVAFSASTGELLIATVEPAAAHAVHGGSPGNAPSACAWIVMMHPRSAVAVEGALSQAASLRLVSPPEELPAADPEAPTTVAPFAAWDAEQLLQAADERLARRLAAAGAAALAGRPWGVTGCSRDPGGLLAARTVPGAVFPVLLVASARGQATTGDSAGAALEALVFGTVPVLRLPLPAPTGCTPLACAAAPHLGSLSALSFVTTARSPLDDRNGSASCVSLLCCDTRAVARAGGLGRVLAAADLVAVMASCVAHCAASAAHAVAEWRCAASALARDMRLLEKAVADHHAGPPHEVEEMRAVAARCYPGSPVAFAASELYRLLNVGASGPGLGHCLEVDLPEAALAKLQVRGWV